MDQVHATTPLEVLNCSIKLFEMGHTCFLALQSIAVAGRIVA
ncbi:hypothetical protein BF49_6457 [Bradyrhizobium sp.]|nr:hypothetical protein BF49_6457 [Bradyrhizobium sp.]